MESNTVSIIKQVEELTNYKFSLSKKTNELVVKDANNKVVTESTYAPFLKLVQSQLQTEDLKDQIVGGLINRKEFAAYANYMKYDEEYIKRQESEPFVVTHIGSPNRGYKLGYYPSGHYKVGKTFQSLDFKIKQLGLPKDESPKFDVFYALESYDPFSSEVIFLDNNKEDYYLNMYRPSIYMEIHRGYYPKFPLLPINKFTELPSVLQAFFIHLLPCAKDRNYFLQWLAWSVFEQCETIPILFGNGGTGKGTLTSIWSRMLGINNWAPMNASSLEGEFSMAHFVNKRGVSVNEGQITNPQQMENLKNSTDRYIRVNDKNEKFKTVKKTHSLMYTANHLDAIKGLSPEGERRFSFLGVTNEKLPNARVTIPSGEVVVFDKDNLEKINPSEDTEGEIHDTTFALFSFLANMYDSKALDPSIKHVAHNNSQKEKEINEASAPQWFMDILETIMPKCDWHRCQYHTDFEDYVVLEDIILFYKNQNPRPKMVPSMASLIKQFKTRENIHKDVMIKNGKTSRANKVYFKKDLYKSIMGEE